MKKILLTGFGLMCIQVSFAQISIAIESGVQMSRLRMKSQFVTVNTDLTGGLRAGANADVRVLDAFHIQAGLSYVGMGGRDKIEMKDIYGNMQGYRSIITRLNYLQLPLSFTYMSGKTGSNRFFAGAGPYIAYTLSGWQSSQGQRADMIVGNNQYCNINTIDAGFHINAGYLFAKGLYARAYYMRGVTNNWTERPGYSINNVGFGLSLGYNLPM